MLCYVSSYHAAIWTLIHLLLSTAEAPSRKAQRTEAEMALRRSETARKRKHQDAQRLEDEKTETINRLLKKQSAKTRNKKLLEASVDEAGLPVDNSTGAVPENRTTIPCYRWVSSSKEASVALSFSLPSVANGLQTDGETTSFVASQPPVVRPTATCAVSGCTLERKYRLAGAADFEKGACGMDHLKLLKTQAV
ncbi:hypothetical protein BDV93DRAFT_442474 [Ceratobasidium sp. AG-I]|nr:hypothetical protein BDV93DRAFT_442474 [Ceratobasidium sp. AG-I]